MCSMHFCNLGELIFLYFVLLVCYKCMIKDIIDILQLSDFHNESQDVDIAKGKYQIPYTWDEVKNLFRRM